MARIAPIQIRRRRDPHVFRIVRIRWLKGDEAIHASVWQRAKQHGVRDGEDGGRQPDSQRQRTSGANSERRALQERSNAEAEVRQQSRHQSRPALSISASDAGSPEAQATEDDGDGNLGASTRSAPSRGRVR